jgi:hypothetical protein
VVHVQVHRFLPSGFSGFLLLIHHSGSRSDSFLGFLLLIHHDPASWHSGSLLLIHHVLVVHVQVPSQVSKINSLLDFFRSLADAVSWISSGLKIPRSSGFLRSPGLFTIT